MSTEVETSSRYFRFQKQKELELVRLPTFSPLPRGMSVLSLVPLAPFLDFARNDNEGARMDYLA
jgi:hypothetical protein